MVHLEAKNLAEGLKQEEMPNLLKVLKKIGYHFYPYNSCIFYIKWTNARFCSYLWNNHVLQ